MAAVWRLGSRLGLERGVLSVTQQLKCLQTPIGHAIRNDYSTNDVKRSETSSKLSWRNLLQRKAPSLKSPRSTREPEHLQSLVPVEDSSETTDLIEIPSETVQPDNSSKTKLLMEKFIPLTSQQLVSGLAKEISLFSPWEIKQMNELALSLDAYISRRYYVQLEEMKFLYDMMDPDKDTIQTRKVDKKDLFKEEYQFMQKLELLLSKANFYRTQQSEILKMFQSHDVTEGVQVTVDPSKYDTLKVWTRGLRSSHISMLERIKHRAKRILLRQKDLGSNTFEYFTRVLVAVRSKNSEKLHLKIFKDVPCNDLEYLIPDGKIEMSKFDKGFLMSSVFLGTVAISVKLFTVAANLNIDYGLIGLAIAGLIGTKGWVGYKNKRNKYLVNLSRTLYFKTVANNRGVLTLLTDRAEDEEFKEALLAYMFLLSPPNRRGVPGTSYTPQSPSYHTMDTLQEQVEKWLHDTFKLDKVSFDVSDAVLKLDQMGLLVRHADSTLAVVPIDIALETLPSDPMYSTQTFNKITTSNSNTQVDSSSNNDIRHYPGWQ